MIASQLPDLAPDWSLSATPELCCPLCEYNLRGLQQPRCPECGFAFTWAELIRGQQEKHPYLFEHQPKRNIWSFCKTFWNDLWPGRFWRQINPAFPVNLPRLMVYWCVSYFPLSVLLLAPFLWSLADTYTKPRRYFFNGSRFLNPTGVVPPFMTRIQIAWLRSTYTLNRSMLSAELLVVLCWPLLTFICLMVFAQSMRRAKIRRRHVLRVVVYGCDFALLLSIVLMLGKDARLESGWPVLVALVCAAVTLHRGYYAYSKYLRFHQPLLTVLGSQIMVFLAALIFYLKMYTS